MVRECVCYALRTVARARDNFKLNDQQAKAGGAYIVECVNAVRKLGKRQILQTHRMCVTNDAAYVWAFSYIYVHR